MFLEEKKFDKIINVGSNVFFKIYFVKKILCKWGRIVMLFCGKIVWIKIEVYFNV